MYRDIVISTVFELYSGIVNVMVEPNGRFSPSLSWLGRRPST